MPEVNEQYGEERQCKQCACRNCDFLSRMAAFSSIWHVATLTCLIMAMLSAQRMSFDPNPTMHWMPICYLLYMVYGTALELSVQQATVGIGNCLWRLQQWKQGKRRCLRPAKKVGNRRHHVRRSHAKNQFSVARSIDMMKVFLRMLLVVVMSWSLVFCSMHEKSLLVTQSRTACTQACVSTQQLLTACQGMVPRSQNQEQKYAYVVWEWSAHR